MNSDIQDIRVFNHNGIVSAMVITESPEMYLNFKPNKIEKIDNTTILSFTGSNVYDLVVSKIENVDYHHEVNLITRSNFVPFKYEIMNPLGIPPRRVRPSDTGYDLYMINIHKVIGKVIVYGTGISVQPPGGYYFDLVPHSSIIETGYILANSVGIIDQSYTGEIMVPLLKVDPDAPDIQLPIKLVQLIPRRWHCLMPEEN